MKKSILLVLALLLTLGTYVAVGPYLTVRAIRSSVQAQDATALSKQVDFPALRGSLKAQLTDKLVRKAGADLQANPFGAFGLSIAGGVIGGVVDTMVTPLGLGAIMEGRKTWKYLDQNTASTSTTEASTSNVSTSGPLHDATYRYESFSRFVATVRDRDGEPVDFVLTRRGMRWRLSDIRLPQ